MLEDIKSPWLRALITVVAFLPLAGLGALGWVMIERAQQSYERVNPIVSDREDQK